MTTLSFTADNDFATSHPGVKFMYVHSCVLDGFTQAVFRSGGAGGTVMLTIGDENPYQPALPTYIGPNMHLDVTGTGTATVVVS